ncbi:hypothetical protein [Sphingomonas sp. T9W2]|uniref:hypothetical protein n=1 Tax=Sphingomonas sp. T9W2 TaxID=3143183 RepID=UPI0031F566C6
MSADERCATCEWWQAGAPARAYAETLPGNPEMFLGVCIVNPPMIVGSDPQTATPMFPRTHQNRRCAAWEEREVGDPNDGERAPTGFVVNLADHRGRAA